MVLIVETGEAASITHCPPQAGDAPVILGEVVERGDGEQSPIQARSVVTAGTARRRVGILISGRGSNMASLIEAARSPDYSAEIALVLSNRPDAPGLARAAEAGIPTALVDHTRFTGRAAFEAELARSSPRTGVDSSASRASCASSPIRSPRHGPAGC
jgi:hypothetical protein